MEIIHQIQAKGGKMCKAKNMRATSCLQVNRKQPVAQKWKLNTWAQGHSPSLSLLWFPLCNGIPRLPDRLPSRLSYSHRWLSLSCKLPEHLHVWAPSGGPLGSSHGQLHPVNLPSAPCSTLTSYFPSFKLVFSWRKDIFRFSRGGEEQWIMAWTANTSKLRNLQHYWHQHGWMTLNASSGAALLITLCNMQIWEVFWKF